MAKKHKIALSDSELRLLVDCLNWCKDGDSNEAVTDRDKEVISLTYDDLIVRLRKSIRKED